MRQIVVVAIVVFIVSLVPTGAKAQDTDQYKMWMKQVDKVRDSLRKQLKRKSGDAAVEDANNLAKLFAEVGDFWKKRNADDAVQFAGDSATKFQQVSELAKGGKFEEAGATLKMADANCSGCHKAHRSITIHGSEIK